jgi:N-acetylmuramoyl-L-alanine amidase
MNRRDFLKYLGISAPLQKRLICRLLTAQGSIFLEGLLHGSASAEEKTLLAVSELKHWSTPDYTRISITLEKEARFQHHKIPNRLYLDIEGAKLNRGVKDLVIDDGLLKRVRIAQFKASTVRVVLDLDSIKSYKVFTFSEPFRIIIDVKGERRQEISASKDVIETAKPEPAPVEKIRPDKTFNPGRIRRIVIDPGHGGHDPGATSPSGTREKDIVLLIALKLAQKVREELGIDVVMTRSTDVFIELQERTAIANKVGADLFISIHANASLNRAANGIETYYLNLAKTKKAAQLAAKENGTTLEKVSLLQAVLFDLMANYKLNDSAQLANEVQKALHKKAQSGYPSVKNLGVKQGPFYVLVGATMPSILVETAFVSNDKDEQQLKDPHYQDLTAEGILLGIKGYIASLK